MPTAAATTAKDDVPAVVEDVASPASSSPGPGSTFVFAAWKAELELLLQSEGESVHSCVQSLQLEFDEHAQHVRGDFAWRKQVAAFHDRLQDALATQIGSFVSDVSSHAALVADSLAQTLARAERNGQLALQQQEQQGEAAMRRARTALSKEMDRITRLEKCLRQEEARQAAAVLAERERQLTAAHEERERHLQALLDDLRSSNDSLEALNTQLLDGLRTSRAEAEQLRNTLVRSMARAKRKSSVSVQQDRTGDKGGRKNTSRAASTVDALPSTPNEMLLVPTLRQSLSEATQTIGNLKTRVSELENAQKSDKHKLHEAQLSQIQAESEKTKATKLLAEARLTLIDNEKQLLEAAEENERLRDRLEELETLSGGRERALADAKRFEDATREHIDSLTGRLQRLAAVEARRREFGDAVARWKQTQSGTDEVNQTNNMDLHNIMESYLHFGTSEGAETTKLLALTESHEEVEKRLLYEFERRFGNQLNLRISLERRRLLELLERQCAVESKERQEHKQRPRHSISRLKSSESDFTRLRRLTKSAYDQLGVCVGAWSETDLDGLHACIAMLKSQIQVLERHLEVAANQAEAQRVHLARLELAQQEKDLLLAELTARYRQLRTTQAAWSTELQDQEQRQPLERKPLTVYGVPQPLVQKPRLHALMQLPIRPRPASASPCLASTARPPLASPSRLGSLVTSNGYSTARALKHNGERDEEAKDHVRSVLKAELLQNENQLEETVGTDGVLAILHRRRHRKC